MPESSQTKNLERPYHIKFSENTKVFKSSIKNWKGNLIKIGKENFVIL